MGTTQVSQPNETIVTALNKVLADYQVLYMKLRNYHWNVDGPQFFKLHEKFEELYNETADKVDEVAERILSVGGRPLSTLRESLEVSSLQEDPQPGDANDMVSKLIADYQGINQKLVSLIDEAEKAGDRATANLLDGFNDEQEKTLWMLRAYLA